MQKGVTRNPWVTQDKQAGLSETKKKEGHMKGKKREREANYNGSILCTVWALMFQALYKDIQC